MNKLIDSVIDFFLYMNYLLIYRKYDWLYLLKKIGKQCIKHDTPLKKQSNRCQNYKDILR